MMKLFKYISVILLPLFVFFVSCQLEEPDLEETPSKTGDYDFSKYVAIGNSLTAGVQSGSLVEEHQQYSFPNLIAQQLGVDDFEQPTVSWPGIPNIMTVEMVTETGVVLGTASGNAVPTNDELTRPYDNLGIPGIVLADVLSATDVASSYSGSTAIPLVLRNQGTTVIEQATTLQPAFISCWIGNNDVLGFATSGGYNPSEPTDAIGFSALYNQLGGALAATNAKVVVANIPDVTSIPFFTTVGPRVALGLAGAKQQNPDIDGLYYQKHGVVNPNPQTDFTNFDEDVPPLITLVGGQYAGLLGQPTGKWYRDLAADLDTTVDLVLATMPSIDTTEAFGFHPHNPWPDALILDADEIETAQTATDAYNDAIASVADQNGFALFDVNDFFTGVAQNGYDPAGMLDVLTADYITGGLFSYDGVHPSNLGYAVLANEFIKVVNEEFGTDIQEVDLTAVSGKQPGTVPLNEFNLSLMKNTVEQMGGKIQ